MSATGIEVESVGSSKLTAGCQRYQAGAGLTHEPQVWL